MLWSEAGVPRGSTKPKGSASACRIDGSERVREISTSRSESRATTPAMPALAPRSKLSLPRITRNSARPGERATNRRSRLALTSLGRTARLAGGPKRASRRSVNVRRRPPSLTAGIASASPGTTSVPAVPPVRR